MFGNTQQVKNLKTEIRSLEMDKQRLESQNKDLQKKLDTFDERRKDEIEDISRKHNRETSKLGRDLSETQEDHEHELQRRTKREEELETQVENLQSQLDDQSNLEVRSLELDQRAALLDAAEINAKNLTEKLAEVRKQGEETGEYRYKAGYADGIADGLREAHSITSEDRERAHQISMINAANSGAAPNKDLVTAVTQQVKKALPSGTTSRKK